MEHHRIMSKNKAAVDLGRRGGLAGTPAQAAARKRNAKIAGLARLMQLRANASQPARTEILAEEKGAE